MCTVRKLSLQFQDTHTIPKCIVKHLTNLLSYDLCTWCDALKKLEIQHCSFLSSFLCRRLQDLHLITYGLDCRTTALQWASIVWFYSFFTQPLTPLDQTEKKVQFPFDITLFSLRARAAHVSTLFPACQGY